MKPNQVHNAAYLAFGKWKLCTEFQFWPAKPGEHVSTHIELCSSQCGGCIKISKTVGSQKHIRSSSYWVVQEGTDIE